MTTLPTPASVMRPTISPGPVLAVARGVIALPTFMPDATLGVVRAVDSLDLRRVGIAALVMNVFHLMQKPGTSTIHALGGLHKMTHWDGPIITDSGGFQAYSLIRQNAKFGVLSDAGIRFQPENSDRTFHLTPEKSVQLQMAYGADIVICLDDCTNVDDAPAVQETSVARTIAWARRCKDEFLRQLRQRKLALDAPARPLLFGVVQGGGSPALRARCANALLEIGFDGYGFGGWPLDSAGHLVTEMLAATREAIPREFPMHALGVGHPESIVACASMGYGLFDSALPTRDARTGRLYTYTSDPSGRDFRLAGAWFRTLYIDDEKHIKTDRPLFPGCDCPTCAQYSVGYLRHLHKCGDTLYFRLATLHNLRFIVRLTELIRADSQPDAANSDDAGDSANADNRDYGN